ncbi:hypothetical protein [Parabacteroides sp. Marseille-P3160]|uniref:hypothetical protein n=1 Tax=Parabacteroides sp. Marseille-P3160 TaxID=1917887 RepID=UPI0009BAD70D|nr:hypothetical protein [Parabacteroides sp. Marseille-P3160]
MEQKIGLYRYMGNEIRLYVFENIGNGERLIAIFRPTSINKYDESGNSVPAKGLDAKIVSGIDLDTFNELYDNAIKLMGIEIPEP